MAEDVIGKPVFDPKKPAAPPFGTTLVAQEAPREEPKPARLSRWAAYRNRFGVIFVVLAVIAGIAVGALVVLVGRGGPSAPPVWSSWKPIGSTERRSAQIGDQVGTKYHLPTGQPLAVVLFAGPPTVTGPDGTTFAVRAIAVRPDTTAGRAEATDIDTIDANTTVMYTLCGLGDACAIADGEPSIERGQLLRREALELALYSFKYLDGIDSTLVLLPPRKDGQAATAVFLERSDVKKMLDRPLSETLTKQTPELGAISPNEAQMIDSVTLSRLYEYTYLQAQDGSPVMVLSPALTS